MLWLAVESPGRLSETYDFVSIASALGVGSTMAAVPVSIIV
jgi:hypothetical protein